MRRILPIFLIFAGILAAAISTTPVHQAVGSTTVTMTAVTVNNTIICAITAVRSAGARTVSSVTLTNTTGWAKWVGGTNATPGIDTEIWGGYVTASGATALTITMSGTGSTVVSNCSEWSGIYIPTPADGTGAVNSGTSGSPGNGAYTSTAANALVITALGYTANASAPTAQPSGYTALTFTNNSTTIALQANYKVPAAAGSQTAAWTMTSNAFADAIIAAKPSVSASSVVY